MHERHRQTGQDRQRTDSVGRTVLQTVAQKWFALCYRTVVCHVCLSLLSVTLVYCGQTVEWIKTKLGMMVGLGHIVLDGDPAPRQKGAQPRIFGPCLFWPNGWMDQDATWYGDRLLPRRHCVRWGPSSPPKKTGTAPNFRSMSIVAKRSPISATAEHLSIMCMLRVGCWCNACADDRQ